MKGNSLHSNKQLGSFRSWVENELSEIQYLLHQKAKDFISEQTEFFYSHDLKLNTGKWTYISSKKNEGYIGYEHFDENGIPVIKLTYNTFKQGGHSASFNSYNALKEIWQEKKTGLVSPKNAYKHYQQQSLNKKNTHNESSASKSLIEDMKLWDSLSRAGQSGYLERKCLPNLKGFRFSNHFIAVKIIDNKGAFCGLQKIYDDGLKLFSKGLKKKGNFALIGTDSLPKTLEVINVCEGIATAGSIHLATLEPVFAALDAYNIEHVVRNLKLQYPKAKIIIWADNDQWKSEELDFKGRPIGNTGLIHANYTAMIFSNIYVVYPQFSNNTSAEEHGLTDFNDLHIHEGLYALDKVELNLPNINIALTKKTQKLEKIHHGILSAKQFKNGRKITVNSKYLSNIKITEGINLVRSPIGTGKTELVEKYISENKNSSVIFLTHLVSLIEDASKRLGLKSYSQCDNFDLQMQRRLAICLNSIGKLTAEGDLPNYDVLIIDEAEQVFKRLASKLEQKTLIFGILKQLVRNTKTVVCLDAHLSTLSVSLIKTWCKDKPVNVVFNEYQVGLGREIVLYGNKESLQVEALNRLRSGNNCYLTFNSKNEARKTYHLFQKSLPKKKGLFISSDNNGDKEVKDFFEDVNKESLKYDYIICTPSISTGVSISNKHFNFVAGIFNSDINTPNDCMQAIGRVRDSNQIHIFVEKRRSNLPVDSSIIARSWNETHSFDLNLMNLSDNGERIIISPEYESIRIKTIQNKNRGHNNFYYEFCLLNKLDGYTVKFSDFRLDQTERKNLKKVKTYFSKTTYLNEIMDAEFIDMTIAKLIENKSRKELRESLSFEKHKLIEFYKLDKYNDFQVQNFILLDDNGKLRKKVINLELTLNDKEYATRLFKQQFEGHEQFSADLSHFATKQLLYKKLLKHLKLLDEYDNLIWDHDGYSFKYNKETLVASSFFEWLATNHSILQGIINLPSIEKLKNEPIRFISKLLSDLGLKQKRKGKTEDGNFYTLDIESLWLMHSIMEQRGSAIGNSCDVNIVNKTQTVPASTVPKLKENYKYLIDSYSKKINQRMLMLKDELYMSFGGNKQWLRT